MTIQLNLSRLPIEHVGFSYSILGELLLSLKVLNRYRFHPLHINWALAANRQIKPALRAEIGRFHPVIAALSALSLVEQNVSPPNFERELSNLSSMPAQQFAELLLNDFLLDVPPNGRRIWDKKYSHDEFCESHDLQSQARRWLTQYYGEPADLIDQLCWHPDELQQAVMQLISHYWDAFFQEEWVRLEPFLLADIQSCGRQLVRDGVLQLLPKLSDRFSIDAKTGSVTYFNMGDDENKNLSENDYLNFYPTYFTYPSIIFSFRHDVRFGTLTVSITYPIAQQQQAGQAPIPSEALVSILRAVADNTRLQILQLVAHKPCSTKELARIIGVSEAGISKHLKQMQKAGWVTAERESYYVLYSANQSPLKQLTQGISEIFSGSPFKV